MNDEQFKAEYTRLLREASRQAARGVPIATNPTFAAEPAVRSNLIDMLDMFVTVPLQVMRGAWALLVIFVLFAFLPALALEVIFKSVVWWCEREVVIYDAPYHSHWTPVDYERHRVLAMAAAARNAPPRERPRFVLLAFALDTLFFFASLLVEILYRLGRYASTRTPLRLAFPVFVDVSDAVAYVVQRLRFNQYTDRAYLGWQRVCTWVSQRIPLFVFGVVFLYLTSRLVGSGFGAPDGHVELVPWERVKTIFPVPDYILRAAAERSCRGSRCRSRIDSDWSRDVSVSSKPAASVPTTASLSTGPATVTVTKTSTEPRNLWLDPDNTTAPFQFFPVDQHPKERTQFGDSWLWCRTCQQWHCCELPY